MAVNFIRWNPSTHIYELSTNDGASFAALPLNASIINEGALAKARQHAQTAYKDEANVFTTIQEISAATPGLALTESDRGTDLKKWLAYVETEIFRLTTLNDAGGGLVQGFTLDRSGNATILGRLDVSGIIGALGGQVAFPATAIASSDPNTLDEYEEGDWTPTIGGSGGQSGQVYSAQVGKYIKIGQAVIAGFRVILSTLGTITTDVQVQGLPFVVNSSVSSMGVVQWLATTATFVNIIGVALTSSSAITMRGAKVAATTNSTPLAQADLSATTSLSGVIVYKASS